MCTGRVIAPVSHPPARPPRTPRVARVRLGGSGQAGGSHAHQADRGSQPPDRVADRGLPRRPARAPSLRPIATIERDGFNVLDVGLGSQSGTLSTRRTTAEPTPRASTSCRCNLRRAGRRHRRPRPAPARSDRPRRAGALRGRPDARGDRGAAHRLGRAPRHRQVLRAPYHRASVRATCSRGACGRSCSTRQPGANYFGNRHRVELPVSPARRGRRGVIGENLCGLERIDWPGRSSACCRSAWRGRRRPGPRRQPCASRPERLAPAGSPA